MENADVFHYEDTFSGTEFRWKTIHGAPGLVSTIGIASLPPQRSEILHVKYLLREFSRFQRAHPRDHRPRRTTRARDQRGTRGVLQENLPDGSILASTASSTRSRHWSDESRIHKSRVVGEGAAVYRARRRHEIVTDLRKW